MIFRTGRTLLDINVHTNKRTQFADLMAYLQSEGPENQYVSALCGMPGTGKTALTEQTICALLQQGVSPDSIGYVISEKGDTFHRLYLELQNNKHHFKYIFIDEIGRFSNFLLDGSFLYDALVRIFNCKVVITDANTLPIYTAMKNTLYDRCKAISVPYLSFEEHCKLIASKGAPTESVWKEYLQHGGLFEVQEVPEYIQTSIVEPIENLLLTQPKRELSTWLDIKERSIDWFQCIDTILLLSTQYGRNSEKRHGLDEQIEQDFNHYFSLSKQDRAYRIKRTETVALLDFFTHIGLLQASMNPIILPPFLYHYYKSRE